MRSGQIDGRSHKVKEQTQFGSSLSPIIFVAPRAECLYCQSSLTSYILSHIRLGGFPAGGGGRRLWSAPLVEECVPVRRRQRPGGRVAVLHCCTSKGEAPARKAATGPSHTSARAGRHRHDAGPIRACGGSLRLRSGDGATAATRRSPARRGPARVGAGRAARSHTRTVPPEESLRWRLPHRRASRQSSQPPYDTTSSTTKKAPSCAANRSGPALSYQGPPYIGKASNSHGSRPVWSR